ncbi:MAG: hypothetical protein R3245_03690, partial [Kiloniellales bacterium]|nr:hypothetical protein [Kiloniellales bacterium]
PAVKAVIDRAEEHLDARKTDLRDIPKGLRAAYLPARLARHQCGLLRKAGYDPYDARVMTASPQRVWHLFWAHASGRIA